MKITYNGTVIAAEFCDGGTDSVQGFDPDSTPSVDWSEPLRATYAIPLARANAKTTITGTILRAAEDTLGAALVAKALQFGELPPTGDLVLTQDDGTITWAAAVKGPCRLLKDPLRGVSWGFQVTFYAGAPSNASASGAGIGTEDGTPLGS